MTKKSTVLSVISKKGKEKITMLTAYDYQTACIMDETDIDIILVGDSLGNVILGYETTIPVTLDEMIHHAKAVVRGAKKPLIVVDMPFMTFQLGVKESLKNAGKIIKETGANAVKIEGGKEMTDIIEALVSSGIPVMGHIGLKPQSINTIGRFSLQNKGQKGLEALLTDAKAVEEAGAFSVVLELVPQQAAKMVTEALFIPTIGIGAGKHTDGQVLVINDMLGYDSKSYFKHTRKYMNLGEDIKKAIDNYVDDVKSGDFPSKKESFE